MAGQITHVDIPADDIQRAKRFYAAVAGWEIGPVEGFPDYEMFRTGEKSGGGIGLRGRTAPARIRLYVTVDRLEDALAAVEANGGTVAEPPTEIPGMGRYAAVNDPEGNEIGLWETGPEG
jgi:predicted enzyme related to lactoylglutathione lyase